MGSVIADGWNYRTNSSIFSTLNPLDEHGTRVAGIIGAGRNNTIGIAGIAGGDGLVNPGVRIYSLGVVYIDFNNDIVLPWFPIPPIRR